MRHLTYLILPKLQTINFSGAKSILVGQKIKTPRESKERYLYMRLYTNRPTKRKSAPLK